ncbi:MAG: DUF763 domain-containing protein [Bacillota bacterium]|nr:DUF763 domain-containing protein [Bacillota bacterium]
MATRTGVADLPLHGGHCPPWLFRRMVELSGGILEAVVLEYGPREVLRRFADPFWYQAFGSVLGFDWHSSGLTTTVAGAVKIALAQRGRDLGLFAAGGKGATSRRTPREIETAADRYALAFDPTSLVGASRLAAKVDSVAVQDGFELYHHTFLFTADGAWAVVQQGMERGGRWARRYHWLGEQVKSFVQEPHSAVCSDRRGPTLNLVDPESGPARTTIAALAREERPDAVLRDYRRLLDWLDSGAGREARAAARAARGVQAARTARLARAGQLSLLEASAPGATAGGGAADGAAAAEDSPDGASRALVRYLSLPAAHAVPDADRLDRILRRVYERQVPDFQALIGLPGVGAQTVRALSMVAEVVHGVPASFRDPVRYSFAHGGKDGHPYPVDRAAYDRSIRVLADAVERARLGDREKLEATRRLAALAGGSRAGRQAHQLGSVAIPLVLQGRNRAGTGAVIADGTLSD